MNGGKLRWDLLNPPDKLGKQPLEITEFDSGPVPPLSDLACNVVGITRLPQDKSGEIPFASFLGQADQSRGMANTDDKYPRCQWVECPGMPHFRWPNKSHHTIDHIPRGETNRLVEIENAAKFHQIRIS